MKELSERLTVKAVNRLGFLYPVTKLYLDGKKISEQTGMDYANWVVEDNLVQYGTWGFRVIPMGIDKGTAALSPQPRPKPAKSNDAKSKETDK